MAADAAVLVNEFPEKSYEGFFSGQFGSRKHLPGLSYTSLYNLPRLT